MAYTPLHLVTSTEPAHTTQQSASTQSHLTARHKPTSHIYSITQAAAGQSGGTTTTKTVNDAGNITLALSESTPHIPMLRRAQRMTQDDYGMYESGKYYIGQVDRVEEVLQVEAMHAKGKKKQVVGTEDIRRGKDEMPEVASDVMALVELVEDQLRQEACVDIEQGTSKPNNCISTHISHHVDFPLAQSASLQHIGKYNSKSSADFRHLPLMNAVTQEKDSPLINPSHPVVAYSTLASLTALPHQHTSTTTTITYVTSPHPDHHHQCYYHTGTHSSLTHTPRQPITSCLPLLAPRPADTSIPLHLTQPKPANLLQYLHHSGYYGGSGVQKCGTIPPSIRPVLASQHAHQPALFPHFSTTTPSCHKQGGATLLPSIPQGSET